MLSNHHLADSDRHRIDESLNTIDVVETAAVTRSAFFWRSLAAAASDLTRSVVTQTSETW